MGKLWGLKKVRVLRLCDVFKWKGSGLNLKIYIVDGVVFRILYVLEAIVLVSTLCFFFLCCGCHF